MIDPLLYVVAFGAVLVALLMLYAMRTGKKKKKEEPSEVPEFPDIKERWPLGIERSVTSEDAKKAQEELRMLDLEREILSYAIRRLYEAQAEGKISEEERERLALGYKERMLKIKDLISRNESVVALHELETMQVDLVKLFNERFDEINKKIEDLRSSLEFKPVMEVPIPARARARAPPSPPTEKEKRRARKPPAPKKTEAEKRIEEIRAEVEKVLERLGQIEVEA